MRCFGRSRSRLVLLVTVAGLCAAAAPGTVLADDGVEPPSVDPSEIAAVPEVEESVMAIVVDAIEETTEDPAATDVVPEADTDDPGEEAGSSDDVPDDAEAPATTDAEEPEGTGDRPSQAGSEPDTASDSGDTAPGSTAPATTANVGSAAPQPAAPTAPPATATPGGAANVNVSIRIGSAGDNGAVTQTNTGAATTPSPAGSRNAASTPAGRQDTGASTTASSDPGSTWYWEWDCLGSPVLGSISPQGSADGSMPLTWTWIWNCPNNSERYQDGPDSQYQQINANVSIRISSPGNDGPVTQSNIAAAVSAELPEVSLPSIPSIRALPSLPAITIPMPAISLPTISIPMPSIRDEMRGIGWSTTSPSPMTPSLVVVPAISIGSNAPWVIDLAGGELAIEAAVEIVVSPNATVEAEALPPVAEVAAAPSPPPDVGALPAQPQRPAPIEPGRASVAATATGSETGSPAPAAAAQAAQPAHDTDAPPRAKPAPSWKPGAATSGQGAPSAAPSTATASAAGAGGSSGGGLPIFLALPFLAAVLDLARRVALERATWPSGHRRRIPDTPG